MKTSILLFSLWMPVTAVAFPTNAAVIKNDSPRGQARYQSTQLSPSLNIGAEQVVDIHGRNVGIPDDFVVMEVVGGENSVPMQPKPDVRKLNYISGIQHLYQGEHVSLEKL